MTPRAMVPVLLAILAHPAAAVDVTGCDQQIPAGMVGVLQSDLDCSGSGSCVSDPVPHPCSANADCSVGFCVYSGDRGLMLADRAGLQMNGHTLTNGGVWCSASCSVSGPGTLSGGSGIFASGDFRGDGTLDVHGVENGILVFGRGTLSDVTVSGVVDNFGIDVRGRLRATNVTSNGSRVGIVAERNFVGENISTNDNGYAGVLAYEGLRVTGLTAAGNGFGVLYGGDRGRPRLYDSTVTGNLLDLVSTHMPRLIRSTCDHSAMFQSNRPGPASWGVCTQD
jgi:hypothetical protein